ncbi:MAG: ATP-dependent 6-phosphofructokinase [Caldisericia bacterium]|nr:ATP-dependent 6-phosphofructokinase [Caldisericia bacterium]
MKTYAILTGGGDCPGLNPAICGATLFALKSGARVLGILEGWRGMIEEEYIELTQNEIADIMGQGGTILGTSRTNPFKREGGPAKVKDTFSKLKIDGLLTAGGDDTLGVSAKLCEMGLPIIGIPKTMDNDLLGTDFTFGFDSAATVAIDAVMRLRDTAKSHRRVMVLEVMGRHAGWVGLYAGLGGYTDYTLIPERNWSWEDLISKVEDAHKRKKHAIVVVSEGIKLAKTTDIEVDEFGHENLSKKDVGIQVAEMISKKTGLVTRSAKLGHIQRGGPPTLFDRILGLRSGVTAMKWLTEGKSGVMAAMQRNEIVEVPLSTVAGGNRNVGNEWLELLEVVE